MAVKKYLFSDKFIIISISLLWLWIGIVYHIIFFSRINPAAFGFGILFIIQGIFFIYSGILKQKLSFDYNYDALHVLGIVFILCSLIIYPLLGNFLGHKYPASPTFGLPCPSVIFTLGLFLWSKTFPKYLLIIPFIWSVIGFFAAINFGVYEDTVLLIAGLVGTGLLVFRKTKLKSE